MKNENQSIQPITTESQSVQFIFPNALVRTKNKSGKLSIRECFKDARKTLMLSRQTVGKNWGCRARLFCIMKMGVATFRSIY